MVKNALQEAQQYVSINLVFSLSCAFWQLSPFPWLAQFRHPVLKSLQVASVVAFVVVVVFVVVAFVVVAFVVVTFLVVVLLVVDFVVVGTVVVTLFKVKQP